MTDWDMPSQSHRPEPPVMHVPPPEPQSRATVFFRLLLVIPQFVVLYLFSLAAMVAGVVGWFAALVLGRLPTPLHRFLCSWLRTTTQVMSYVWLLTGRWPPLVAIPGYPADLECEATRLSRMAVLFRIVLLIPSGLVATFSMFGMTVFAVVIWLIALVKGRLPDTVHRAVAAGVRYTLRYYAFAWMLTSAQPSGLFGDRDRVRHLPEIDPTATPTDPDAVPRPGTLRLNRGAKRLVAAFVVVGAVTYVGGTIASVAPRGTSFVARAELMAAWDDFAEEAQALNSGMSNCDTAPDPLACVREQTGRLSDEIARFQDRVVMIDFPTHAQDQASSLVAAAARFRDATAQLSQARSGEDYQAIAQRTQIGDLGTALDEAYTDLLDAL
ncbi:MAG: DUF4389 domain-containing protein [Actinobacteria bacterium]|nr:DUF4389 domain-containing protein [Actinomycetota bacterium]